MFSSLRFYPFPKDALEAFRPDAEGVLPAEALLAENPVPPVGPQEESSAGFTQPLGKDSQAFTHAVDGAVLTAIGTEKRLLPAAVVKDEVDYRCRLREEQTGERVKGKAKKQLKEEVRLELLPKAFIRKGRLLAYVDNVMQAIVVNTGGSSAAEDYCSHVRQAVGSCPVQPATPGVDMRALLTGWLMGTEALLEGLTLGEYAVLEDAEGGTARIDKQDLRAEDVKAHVEAGKSCVQLSFIFEERVSFVLDTEVAIKRLKWLEKPEKSEEGSDPLAEWDTRLALLVGEVRLLYALLGKACHIEEVKVG